MQNKVQCTDMKTDVTIIECVVSSNASYHKVTYCIVGTTQNSYLSKSKLCIYVFVYKYSILY